MNDILKINKLNVAFYTQRGRLHTIRDLDLSIGEGQTVALVGESGCGKSVTAHSITGLIPTPPGKIESGVIEYKGTNLTDLSPKELRKYRGREISMIFQEPMTSLNPVFTIGQQIADVFRSHESITKKEVMDKAVKLLDLVKIPAPERRVKEYPHQMSGGMRQRVMIAMALASPNPGLIIADEPTTALDVTIQAQILQLLTDLKSQLNVSLLLITHDMGVVSETADKVIVMYAGRKVEEGPVEEIFANPKHPYTIGLLKSLPLSKENKGKSRLETIKGTVPDPLAIGEECPFSNRCSRKTEACSKFPVHATGTDDHMVFCHNPIKRGQDE
ncbi:ABC transporter ATP-binding protein [Spirochaeta cellobiosiphila]|uniref:ABC transporter ATP-binding protein n=1 Tax=Spirochaeta cellobiosiphila TaxID=504483 RepID=UPI0004188E94|nr:ABC transporter ATP-binding protein [Spirochaeta cellobiosiphila]